MSSIEHPLSLMYMHLQTHRENHLYKHGLQTGTGQQPKAVSFPFLQPQIQGDKHTHTGHVLMGPDTHTLFKQQTPHLGISPSDCVCPPGYERAILACVEETAVRYSSSRSPARPRLSQALREGSSQVWMHLITSLIHTPITPK